MVGGLCILIFSLGPWWLANKSWTWWPWVAATVSWTMSLAWPRALTPLHQLFSAVGQRLGSIQQRAMMVLVFTLIITPIGLLLRLMNWDPLCIRRSASGRIRESRRDHKPIDMEVPY